MNSIAKMFFSKRKQHDVGRRRSNGHRRVFRDLDVAGEVDTGDVENALSGQVVRDVRGAATFLTFSVASFLLPLLLAHLLWFVGGLCEGSLRTGWGADGLSLLSH